MSVNAGVGRMEVKIEPDCYHVTECFYDDKPGTGMFEFFYDQFCVILCLLTSMCFCAVFLSLLLCFQLEWDALEHIVLSHISALRHNGLCSVSS